MRSIGNYIQQQLEFNKSKNLLYAWVEQSIEIEPSFLGALEELLAAAAANQKSALTKQEADAAYQIPADVLAFTIQALLDKLYAINQYLRIERSKIAELEEIYRQTWRTMLRSGEIQATLKEYHYPQLSHWVATLYPQSFLEKLKSTPDIGHVVCAEYSAQLQIELLGLDVVSIKEPLLDIGCGAHANLVRYLRTLGVEAYGLDRSLEVRAPYLEALDWFERSFQPHTWGTIVSNMAFSNHFVFVARCDRAQFESYLLQTNAILDALVAGGSFHYAPSLPFIEQRLSPAQYKVVSQQVSGELCTSCVTNISK